MAESSEKEAMDHVAAKRAKLLAKWAGRDARLVEGHDSVRQVGDPEADHSTCRRCGQHYTRGDNFCRACGLSLDAQYCAHCGQVLLK